MAKKYINLVNISRYANGVPAAFIDTVDSVAEVLRSIGYEPTYSSNKIYTDVLNIIWGVGSPFSPTYGEMERLINPANCVIFNMEQLESSSPMVTTEYIEFISRYIVLDYNENNIDSLKKSGAFAGYEFPIVPSKKFAADFKYPEASKKKYHIAFYGTPKPRREEILVALENTGFSIKRIIGKYGVDLSAELHDCHTVINLHAYEESNVFEVARCLRPLAMGIPVISESASMPKSIDWTKSGVITVKKESIIDTYERLRDDAWLLMAHSRDAIRFLHNNDAAKTAMDLMRKVEQTLYPQQRL